MVNCESTPGWRMNNLLWILEHFLGVKLRIKSVPLNKGKKIEIQKVHNLSVSEFKEKYLENNLPVILVGAAKDWEATSKWSLDYFKEHYPNEEQPIIDSSGEEIYKKKVTQEKLEVKTLAEVVDSKDKYYANFSPLVHKYKELRDQLKLNWIFQLQNKLSSLMLYQLFMGAKGKKTELHSEMSSNLFIMLNGKKRWSMCSPKFNSLLDIPVTREPCFHSPVNFMESNAPENYGIDYYDFILEEGDVLFVPPYYWHQVYNETESVGLAIKWHHPYAYLRSSITQSILTTFAINPPLWKLIGKGKYLNLFTDGRES